MPRKTDPMAATITWIDTADRLPPPMPSYKGRRYLFCTSTGHIDIGRYEFNEHAIRERDRQPRWTDGMSPVRYSVRLWAELPTTPVKGEDTHVR